MVSAAAAMSMSSRRSPSAIAVLIAVSIIDQGEVLKTSGAAGLTG